MCDRRGDKEEVEKKREESGKNPHGSTVSIGVILCQRNIQDVYERGRTCPGV